MMIVNEVEELYHDDEQQQQLEQVVTAPIVGRLYNTMRTHLILENTPNNEASGSTTTATTRRFSNPVSSCGSTGSTGGESSAIIENSDEEEDISHDDPNDSCSDRVEEEYYYENEITIVQANDKDSYDNDFDQEIEETSRTKCCLLEFEMEENDDEEEEELWDDNDDDHQRRENNPYNKYRHYPELQSKLLISQQRQQQQQQEDYRSSPTSTMSSSVFEFGDTELSKNDILFVPSSSAFPFFSTNEQRHVTFGAVIQKQVYSIPPNSEYTEKERQQLWYTQEEMHSMRVNRRRERRSFLL